MNFLNGIHTNSFVGRSRVSPVDEAHNGPSHPTAERLI